MSTKLEMLDSLKLLVQKVADSNYHIGFSIGRTNRMASMEHARKAMEDFDAAVEELRKALSE